MKKPDIFQQFNPTTRTELSKSQAVRLWDVFFVGPFFIYLGLKKGLNPTEKFLSMSIGAATIYYNGRNFIYNKQQMEF